MNILDATAHTCNYHILLPLPGHSHEGSTPQKDNGQSGGHSEEFMSSPAIREGLTQSLGNGRTRGAKAVRWGSTGKVLALETILSS